MTLNCINCRTNNSKTEFDSSSSSSSSSYNYNNATTLRSKILAERNWSGTLVPPSYKPSPGMDLSTPNMTPMKKKKPKRAYRRYGSIGAVPIPEEDVVDLLDEPRLVRSGGIRRDWSFEDLLGASKREPKRKLTIC